MRITPLVVLLLSLYGVVAFAESQPPSPTPLEGSGKSQTKAKYNDQASNSEKNKRQDMLADGIVSTPSGETKTVKQGKDEDDKPTNDRIIAWSTVFLAGVTAILAIFTGYLWMATRRLVIGAEKTAERQLRAYVFVIESSITDTDRPEIKRIAVRIKNTGQTPAFNVTHWQNAQIFLYPGTDIFPGKPNVQLSTSMLGLGMATDKLHEIEISPSEGAGIAAGTKGLYIWGEIEYVDAFKITRRTRYCFMRGGHFDICGETLTYCEDGNGAT